MGRVLHTSHTRNCPKATLMSGARGWGIWTGKAGCSVRKTSEKAEGIQASRGLWADTGLVGYSTISLALLLANKEPEIRSYLGVTK